MTQVAAPLPLPADLDMSAGYQVVLNAVDPTTGAQITGVTVSDLAIQVSDVGGNLDLNVGNPVLIGVNVLQAARPLHNSPGGRGGLTTPDARIARVEQLLADLKEDVQEMRDETLRTRTRLHDLEGIAGVLVEQERIRRRATQLRDRRFGRRLQVLTAVVALTGLVEPLLYHLANGG